MLNASKNYDFSGIATQYGVVCGDGRIIEDGCFSHQDGALVPLVWHHRHRDHTQMIQNIIGHATLHNSSDPSGMRVKAFFNNTKEGKRAKQLVQDGTIRHLSIWANELTETYDGKYRRTKHGTIREVSTVLSGQNPGAVIDDVVMHSGDPLHPDYMQEDGIIIHTEFDIEIFEEEEVAEHSYAEEVAEHSPSEEIDESTEMAISESEEEEDVVEHAPEETINDILAGLSENKAKLFDIMIHSAITGEKLPPVSENASNDNGPSLRDVYESLTEKEATALHFMLGELTQDNNLEQGDSTMTFNIFEQDSGSVNNTNRAKSREALKAALKTASEGRISSLKEFLVHSKDDTLVHSITDINNLFPDAQNVSPGGPAFLARRMGWVEKVLSACNTRPFARIKSWYADITPDAARAKGYVTGAQKVEEVLAALKRVTTPQTVYKLQKLDRDDIIDITEFDVVVWLKSEMRMQVREEIARAILISDGRLISDPEKISETNLRPIFNDAAPYTYDAVYVDPTPTPLASMTPDQVVDLIDFIAGTRTHYKGTGEPTFYLTVEAMTKLLLVRDANKQRLHRTEAELAAALRVSDLLEIPPMSGMTETDVTVGVTDYDVLLLGIIVNLADYVIGADKGGATSFFDDFDLDYNKYTYLYETRISGALVVPEAAVTIRLAEAVSAP